MSIANKQANGHGVDSVDRSIKNRFSKVLTLTLVALSTQFAGCISGGNSFDAPIHGYRNHVWANRAFNLRYAKCDVEFSDHFKQGFVDGYCDMCNGGDGYVPAVPPKDYWGYQYQSPEGAKCVNTWFKAYPLGVKAAREDGSGSFQKVYISKMIQSAIVQDEADHVLPDDVPVVSNDGPNVHSTSQVDSPPRSTGSVGPVSYPTPSNSTTHDPTFSK